MTQSEMSHNNSGALTTHIVGSLRLLAVPRYPNNLPLQLSSFIGRENELSAIKQQLWTTRLLTLTGPGGCGKTRLALRVADDLLDAFVDGVWWIDLTPLADPMLIAQTTVTTFGLRVETSSSLVETLIHYLRAKQTLLILDNCEHLIEACAQLIQTLLQTCPDLYVMTTSREVLNIGGEVVYTVPPMSTPHPREVPPLETLAHYEAARLFVERAANALPGFRITAGNAAAIAQVCYRLDGMPLAIELAAARVKVLQVDQIASRLDDRFHLLTGGQRTALHRHQTLRAAIDWSYDLLSEDERRLLRRLSVFAGGWTLEAAEAVCADRVADESASILDRLTQLVNKSLVVADREQGKETRYRMLETIRQYTLERLHESGETSWVRTRHLDYFVAGAGEDTKLHSPEHAIYMKRLDADCDNYRAASDWALESGQAQVGMRMAWGLHTYWWARGYWNEARERIQRLLASPAGVEPTTARAAALILAGNYSYLLSDFAAGWAWLQESQALSRELGAEGRPYLGWSRVIHGESLISHDKVLSQRLFEEGIQLLRESSDSWRLGISLMLYGDLARTQGHLNLALDLHGESLEVLRRVGDVLGIAVATSSLGLALYALGDYASARIHFEEALAIFRNAGLVVVIGSTLGSIGHIAFIQGDYHLAAACFEEGLTIEEEIGSRERRGWMLADFALTVGHLGDRTRAASLWQAAIALHDELGSVYGMAVCVLGLAGLQSQPERATQLLSAAQTAFEVSMEAIEPHYRIEHERQTAAVRAALGAESFALAWAAGRAMSMKQAIALARATLDTPQPNGQIPSTPTSLPVNQRRFGGLTKREREVATLIAQGKSNREIAQTLIVSEYTVASHVSNILSKLEFSSRTQIVSWAIEKGLAKLPIP